MSDLEETLLFQIRACGLPEPDREYRFHPKRRWRFDFAYPDYMLAIEVEGGAWTNGRHTRGKGFIDDLEKYNAATFEGWRVLRYAAGDVKSGVAVGEIERALR